MVDATTLMKLHNGGDNPPQVGVSVNLVPAQQSAVVPGLFMGILCIVLRVHLPTNREDPLEGLTKASNLPRIERC